MNDTPTTPLPTYRVLVDDNFWFGEEDERHEHGSYNTLEEAIAAAKGIVDSFLSANHEPGMTAGELYEKYTDFGDDPFIMGPEPRSDFSAWTYAELRSAEICGTPAVTTKESSNDVKKPVDEKPAGESYHSMDDETLDNNRTLIEAVGFSRLGMLEEANASLRRIAKSDSVNYPAAQHALVVIGLAQHRCAEAAKLGLAAIAEKKHDVEVVVSTALALAFLGRHEEGRGVLELVEDFGRPLAYHAYQMACFGSRTGDFREAFGWLEIEFREPRYFKVRSIGDSDLLPLWSWLATGPLNLEEAHRFLAMPLARWCGAALDPQAEILLDENDLKSIPPDARALFKFNLSKGMCEMDGNAVAANPTLAEEFRSERCRHIAMIVSMIRKARNQALQVVLNAQPHYAAEQAVRGNHLAARYHITWALSHRFDLLSAFLELNFTKLMSPLLDSLLVAEAIDSGYCHRMEKVAELTDVDLDEAWKLLDKTSASLQHHPLTQLRWATVYTADGDDKRALPIYLHLCEVWPNDAAAFANATDSLMRLERWDEADKVFACAPACYSQFERYYVQKENLLDRNMKRPSKPTRIFRGEPDLPGILIPHAEKNLEARQP